MTLTRRQLIALLVGAAAGPAIAAPAAVSANTLGHMIDLQVGDRITFGKDKTEWVKSMFHSCAGLMRVRIRARFARSRNTAFRGRNGQPCQLAGVSG